MSLYEREFNRWERQFLLLHLDFAEGNSCKAARALGIHRNTMTRRLIFQGVTDEEIGELKTESKSPRTFTEKEK